MKKHKANQLAACALALAMALCTALPAQAAAQQELSSTNGLLDWLFGSSQSTEEQPQQTAAAEIPVTEILPGEYQASMQIGTTQLLHPTVLPENATDKTMTIFSENSNIVAVNEQGYIGAQAAGTTRVGITSGDVTIYYTITVEPDASTVVTDMALSISSSALYVGETATLSVAVLPSSASSYNDYTIASSNENVATANLFGQVTAVGAGRATITVTCGDVQRSVEVVVSTKTEGISVDSSFLVLKPGATHTIKASVSPADAPQSLTYTSLDSSVATVNAVGIIQAVGSGSTTITVSNGASKAAITVIVNQNTATDTTTTLPESPTTTVTADQIEALVQTIADTADGKEILVQQSEWPTIPTQVLNALHGTSKTLVISAEGYRLTIKGSDVVNAGNELDTRLDFVQTDDGLAFTLNGGSYMPGRVRVELGETLSQDANYLYLYNTVLTKWQKLNKLSGNILTLDTAGQYLLRAKEYTLWGLNWWYIGAAAVVLVALFIAYIVVKRRYWFW